MIYLTRRAEFSASHYYHSPALSPEENQRLYGKCSNPLGHGHNYLLEVTVTGPIDPRTGMTVNLAELDAFVHAQVLEPMHERSLNELPNFQERVPTTENLCVEIFQILREGWPELESARRALLARVRLEETSSNFFEYRG